MPWSARHKNYLLDDILNRYYSDQQKEEQSKLQKKLEKQKEEESKQQKKQDEKKEQEVVFYSPTKKKSKTKDLGIDDVRGKIKRILDHAENRKFRDAGQAFGTILKVIKLAVILKKLDELKNKEVDETKESDKQEKEK